MMLVMIITTAHFAIGAAVEKVRGFGSSVKLTPIQLDLFIIIISIIVVGVIVLIIILVIIIIIIQVICQSLTTPGQSDVFQQIDRQYLQPKIMEVSSSSSSPSSPSLSLAITSSSSSSPPMSQALSGTSRGTEYTAASLLSDCHTNATLFNILKLEEVRFLKQFLAMMIISTIMMI